MRFMVIVKANKESEAGVLPSTEILAEMTTFNEELVKAGVMLAGEELHASSKGARVRFAGKQRTVIDGPFAETKELIAGFWLWRQVFEADDFGDNMTPELRAQEERLRKQTAKRTVKQK